MTKQERLVLRLIDGAKNGGTDIRVAAIHAIGESGLIDDDRLVDILEDSSKSGGTTIRTAAFSAIGRMLRGANRQ